MEDEDVGQGWIRAIARDSGDFEIAVVVEITHDRETSIRFAVVRRHEGLGPSGLDDALRVEHGQLGGVSVDPDDYFRFPVLVQVCHRGWTLDPVSKRNGPSG